MFDGRCAFCGREVRVGNMCVDCYTHISKGETVFYGGRWHTPEDVYRRRRYEFEKKICSSPRYDLKGGHIGLPSGGV